MTQERKKLSDILLNSEHESLARNWDSTEAADDLTPLPPAEYTCRVLSGELFTSKSRHTPGYKLALEVTEGEHEGRRCWHDIWLTPAALPMAKRDLRKIGITTLDQLERPLPPGILLKVKLALRKDDDGNEHNRVVRFEPAGIEAGDAFEPAADPGTGEDEADTTFTVDAPEANPPSTPGVSAPLTPEAPAQDSASGQQDAQPACRRRGRPRKDGGVTGSGPYGGDRR
jgi:hypothetical protein